MRNKILLVLCLLAPFGWASTISGFNTAELPGERFEVRIQFGDTPPDPKGYTIEKPARIVLDFPNAISELKERRFPLAFDNGQSAMLLTTEGRTRLILNLNELTSYTTRKDGNAFVVEVGANRGVNTAGKMIASKSLDVANKKISSPTVKTNQASISNIDFRRGQSGEGRIVVTLSDPHATADLVSTGAGVKLSFANVALPAELRRRLDVVDFATPVTTISASQEGASSTLNIAASGEFDYMAYQTDNEYVLSVKLLTEQEKADKKKDFQFSGEKLSFNFQDIEVRSVLQIIADFTELNLVASDTVQGRITLRLENVPWDQALSLVLKTKGLDKRVDGNVMMIAPAAEIAERERQELSTRKQLEELAPLRTEYLRVRYASAKEMFALFGGRSGGSGGAGGSGSGGNRATGSVLSERGQAVVDERTNSIIVTDTADRIETFKKLVDQIDIPIRQVMIEARLVIANSNFRRELGVRWGGITYGVSKNSLVEVAGSLDGLKSDPGSPYEVLTGQPGKATDMTNDHVVDLGVGDPAGSLAMGILTDNGFLDMELSALENAGYAEIVSQPKVVTSDKQMAMIKSGKQIPFLESAASGATSTGFKEAVLKLEVTPQITPDNHVIMDLNISKDSIGEVTETGSLTIDINQINTKVLVPNGETVVLGGVFSIDANKSEVKVPVLGDIPYLGRLFKKTTTGETKTELLIFITPKIIADKMTN